MNAIPSDRGGVKPRQCSIEGCTAPHLAKGLCSKHYTRQRRHGHPLRLKAKLGDQPCVVANCGGKPVARGLCARHYIRWQRYGSALAPRVRPPEWTAAEDRAVLGLLEYRQPGGRMPAGMYADVAQVLGRSETAVRIRLRKLLAKREKAES